MAPKKKGQTMSFSDFTSMVESEAPTTTKTSWADEDIELPTAPMAMTEQPEQYDRDFVRGTQRSGRAPRDNAPPPAPVIDYARLPTVGPFNCFIGNLPFEVTEADIRNCFLGVSILGVKIPRDQDQRPRGFAYIELADQDSLIKALLLGGSQIAGRYIRVDIAEGRGGFEEKSFASDWRSGVEHQVTSGGRPNFDRTAGRSPAYPERVFDRSMMSPVVAEPRAASSWRTSAAPVAAERPRSTSSEVSFKSATTTEPKKPVLNLLPRTKPVNAAPEPAEIYKGKPSPFGEAKPVSKTEENK